MLISSPCLKVVMKAFIWITVCLTPGLPAGAVNDQSDGFHLSARRMLEQGRLAEALQLERQACEMAPQNPAYREQLLIIYMRLGQNENALKEAYRLIKLQPDDGLAHFNLAAILHRLGKSREALPEYDKAVRLGETASDVRRGRAICLMENGYIAEAVPELEKISIEEPESKDIWMNLGWAYLQYGDMEASVNAANKALAIDPDYYLGWGLKAQQAKVEKMNGAAVEAGKRMIAIDPAKPYAYWLLGKLSIEGRGDPTLAYLVLKEASHHVSDSSGLFYELGKAFQVKAERLLKKPAALNHKRAMQWIDLSATAYRQCLKTAPDSFDANLASAEVLLLRRDWAEAYTYAARALSLKPADEKANSVYRQASVSQNDLAGWLRKWFQSGILKSI